MRGEEKMSYDPTRYAEHDISYENKECEAIMQKYPKMTEYYGIGGIYSMWIGGTCIYVGCSINMGWRWAHHFFHITNKKSLEYNDNKYYQMRKAFDKGVDIKIVVEQIQPCPDGMDKKLYQQQLKNLEKQYIIELKPRLNNGKDKMTQHIEDLI